MAPRRPTTLAAATTLALLLACSLGLGTGPVSTPAKASGKRKQILGFGGIRPGRDLSPRKTALLTTGIGGNTVRTDVHWQALEPRRGQYAEAEFVRYRSLYRALRARRITPIFVLQYAPAWARDGGAPRRCGASDSCHYPPSTAMLGEWRKFVVTIARRFPKAAIEVWNEPNYIGQWQSGVDPARYARLLAVADSAAASVDPRIPVYAGGLGTTVKDRSLTPPQFLRRAYAANPSLKGHTDAVNIHLFPASGLGPGSAFARNFAQIRRVRDAAGDHRTPILVSEMGRTTSGADRISEAKQADILLRATRKILSMRDALGVLIYTLADRDELPASDHERGFGVGRAGPGGNSNVYHPKPAYCALRHAAGYRGCRPRAGETTRRLRVRVHPRRRRLRPGGRARRVIIRVDAPGELVGAARIRICARGHRRRVRVVGRRCRRVGPLRAGRHVHQSFRVRLRKRGHGRVRLRFVASGRGVRKGSARLRIKPRHRSRR